MEAAEINDPDTLAFDLMGHRPSKSISGMDFIENSTVTTSEECGQPTITHRERLEQDNQKQDSIGRA